MGFRAIVLAAAAAAVLLAGRVEAQADTTSPGIQRLRRACEGSMARVLTASGENVQGRCGPVEDRRLVVSDGNGVREIPFGTVEGLWVRRSGARQGAGLGALIGGVGGAAWGVLVVSALCGEGGGDDGCQEDMLIGAIAGGAAGSLTGLVVGGAIGSVTRVWVRVYP
jgi:hypothetical protein